MTLPGLSFPPWINSKASSPAPQHPPIFFCKLDISNHFWTCKLPPSAAHQIRIGVNGITYSLPSLPFGWKCSPAITQCLLGSYLAVFHHSKVITIQYLDDILLFSLDPTLLRQFTNNIVSQLSSQGWIFSNKSIKRPPQHPFNGWGRPSTEASGLSRPMAPT